VNEIIELSDDRRDRSVEALHEVGQHCDHPRAGDDQSDEDDNQLGHEGQRRFVDLRRGLEDRDQQAGGQRGDEQRGRDQ
jgi:hypothetical protein